MATSIRILRVLVFFISLVAPAVYVATTTFHQEMIPTELLVVIAVPAGKCPVSGCCGGADDGGCF
nr:spore germination protein [Bacillus subtilis]